MEAALRKLLKPTAQHKPEPRRDIRTASFEALLPPPQSRQRLPLAPEFAQTRLGKRRSTQRADTNQRARRGPKVLKWLFRKVALTSVGAVLLGGGLLPGGGLLQGGGLLLGSLLLGWRRPSPRRGPPPRRVPPPRRRLAPKRRRPPRRRLGGYPPGGYPPGWYPPRIQCERLPGDAAGATTARRGDCGWYSQWRYQCLAPAWLQCPLREKEDPSHQSSALGQEVAQRCDG